MGGGRILAMSWSSEQDAFFDQLADVQEFSQTPIWDDLVATMWVSDRYFSQVWVDSEVKRLGIKSPKVVVADLESLDFENYPDDIDEYLLLVDRQTSSDG